MSDVFLVVAGIALLVSGTLSMVSRGPASGRAVTLGAVGVVLVVALSTFLQMGLRDRTLAALVLTGGAALFAAAARRRAQEEGLTHATMASVAASLGLLSLLVNTLVN
ncbi:hypothetical protein [Haloarchaeobius sp. DFWS5]|uniref:hypothetical protein n=1 Tax=Haloarchaeobius sp. DFWS5 TaxID=3446114 RepID=UPI003EB9F2FC